MFDIEYTSTKQRKTSNLLLGCGCATSSCYQRDHMNTLEPPYMTHSLLKYSSDGDDDIDIPVQGQRALGIDPKLRINHKRNQKLNRPLTSIEIVHDDKRERKQSNDAA